MTRAAAMLRGGATACLAVWLLAGCAGAGSVPTTATETETETDSGDGADPDAPRQPSHGAWVRRGPIVDRRGVVLASNDGVGRALHGPVSLQAWVGATAEIDGTIVGESGVERFADVPLLRGEEVRLSLDADTHRQLEVVLAPVERGAAVVIDVSTGELRALVSKGEADGKEPLVRRHLATSQARHSGSTAKPFLAVAALTRGSLQPTTVHDCKGALDVDGERLVCFGTHGKLDMTRALTISDNSYFYHVALGLPHDDIARAQRAFGLGLPVGLPQGDEAGFAPGEAWFRAQPSGFHRAMSLSQAIGHGQLRVTPLQLARGYAMLATGKVVAPHYMRPSDVAVQDRARDVETPAIDGYVGAFAPVRAALRHPLSDEGGTAHFADLDVDAAGKTGTSEQDGTKLGWFAGWTPAQEPRLVVVVLTEGRNGRDAARIALTWLKASGAR